jgi:predicted metal-dependent hydrolase
MVLARRMRSGNHHQIALDGRRVDYRLIASRSARKLRIRVGINGIEVVQPIDRTDADVMSFLNWNGAWILDQLQRVERLRIRVPERQLSEILFRGERTLVRIEEMRARLRENRVTLVDGEIVVQRSSGSKVPASRSLENWLRREARAEIEKHLGIVTARLRQSPCRVYIMGQRTKWGNCSSQRNLSFNWRLIMAPDTVLRYLVTHEAVHLAVPDHSAKFWLTVQSLCRDTERAKQWLVANGHRLTVDLGKICGDRP